MTSLQGKTALVTGGTTGIGFAAARLFQEHGARVAITGRDADRLKEAEAALPGLTAIRSDTADIGAIDALAAEVGRQFGSLDVLFLNAGIAMLAPADQSDEALFDAVFNVNVKGLFFTAQKLAPLMTNGGSIIINTSVNNQMGMAGSSVYAASKAAARSFARTLAGEWIEKGIRVNAISPGPVETPIYGKLGLPQEVLEGFAQKIGGKIPMQRFGQPEEIAKAALFLASSDSSYILGQEIVADGGWTAV